MDFTSTPSGEDVEEITTFGDLLKAAVSLMLKRFCFRLLHFGPRLAFGDWIDAGSQ